MGYLFLFLLFGFLITPTLSAQPDLAPLGEAGITSTTQVAAAVGAGDLNGAPLPPAPRLRPTAAPAAEDLLFTIMLPPTIEQQQRADTEAALNIIALQFADLGHAVTPPVQRPGPQLPELLLPGFAAVSGSF